MRTWNYVVSSIVPIAFVAACSGAASTADPASSDQQSAETAQAGPASKCPATKPAIGSACSVPGTTCSYGNCTDPSGIVELECVAGKWAQIGGARCGDGGARDAAPDAKRACSGGGGANANGVCSSDRDFFASAQGACASERAVLTHFEADQKCGAGSSNSFTYTCCPEEPKGCTSGGFANGNGICSTDNQLFASAEASCGAVSASITAFQLLNTCSASSARGATYTCCP